MKAIEIIKMSKHTKNDIALKCLSDKDFIVSNVKKTIEYVQNNKLTRLSDYANRELKEWYVSNNTLVLVVE